MPASRTPSAEPLTSPGGRAAPPRRLPSRGEPTMSVLDTFDLPAPGTRWSTWTAVAKGQRGPEPYPSWIVTAAAALDTELGILKTGKEADVHLIERSIPD